MMRMRAQAAQYLSYVVEDLEPHLHCSIVVAVANQIRRLTFGKNMALKKPIRRNFGPKQSGS